MNAARLQRVLDRYGRQSPLMYFGFSAVWVIWLILYFEIGFNFTVSKSVDELGHLTQLPPRISLAALLVFAAVCSEGKSRFAVLRFRWLAISSTLTFSVGIAASYLFAGESWTYAFLGIPHHSYMLLVGGLLEGLGFAMLVLSWLVLFSGMSGTCVCCTILGSLPLGAILYFLISCVGSLSVIASGLLYASVSFASSLALVLIGEKEGLASSVPSAKKKPKAPFDKIPITLFAALLVSSMVCGYVSSSIEAIDAKSAIQFRVALLVVVALVSVVMVFACGENFVKRPALLYRISLLIAFIGLAIYPAMLSMDRVSISVYVVLLSHIWFIVCVLLMTAIPPKRASMPRESLLGLVFAADAMGFCIGLVLAKLLSPAIADGPLLYSLLLILMAILFVVLGWLLDVALKKTMPEMHGVKPDDEWISRAGEIADSYALSTREKEVFLLLIKGRRADEIADLLVLSVGTVRNHIHRIYRKFGVGSYKQLVDLVKSSDYVA